MLSPICLGAQYTSLFFIHSLLMTLLSTPIPLPLSYIKQIIVLMRDLW